jgi:hypothetical protein
MLIVRPQGFSVAARRAADEDIGLPICARFDAPTAGVRLTAVLVIPVLAYFASSGHLALLTQIAITALFCLSLI